MRKGFTLIEVLVVAVIVAILAAVAIPAYTAYVSNARDDAAKSHAATIATEAAAFYSRTADDPTNDDLNAIKTLDANFEVTIGTGEISVKHVDSENTQTVSFR